MLTCLDSEKHKVTTAQKRNTSRKAKCLRRGPTCSAAPNASLWQPPALQQVVVAPNPAGHMSSDADVVDVTPLIYPKPPIVACHEEHASRHGWNASQPRLFALFRADVAASVTQASTCFSMLTMHTVLPFNGSLAAVHHSWRLRAQQKGRWCSSDSKQHTAKTDL